MSRYLGPRLRITRRLGNLIGLTRKKPTMKPLYPDNPFGLRKIIPPGQHGRAKLFKKKPYESNEYDFLIRLKLKQRLRFYYGITEKQLLRYVQLARKSKGSTGRVLLRLLEMRLDNIVFRLHMAPTIQAARQLISHGHILVNKKKVTIPSYQCQPKEFITVAPKIRSMELVSRFLTEFDMEKARFQRLVNILQFGKKGLSTGSVFKKPQNQALLKLKKDSLLQKKGVDTTNRSVASNFGQKLKLHSLHDITVQRAGKFDGQGIGYINNSMVIIEPLFSVKELIGKQIKISIYNCISGAPFLNFKSDPSKQKRETYYAYPTGPISMDLNKVSRANSYDLVKYLGQKALILMDAASSIKKESTNRLNTDNKMKSIQIAAVCVFKKKPKKRKGKLGTFQMPQNNNAIIRGNVLQNQNKFAQLRQKDPAGFREKYIYGNYSSSLRGANIRFYAKILKSSVSQTKGSKNMLGHKVLFNPEVLTPLNITRGVLGASFKQKREFLINNGQNSVLYKSPISRNPMLSQNSMYSNSLFINALPNSAVDGSDLNTFVLNAPLLQKAPFTIFKKDLIRNELEKCSKYINQLNEYKMEGIISETVYLNLKQKLINNFFVPLKKEYLSKESLNNFSKDNTVNKNSVVLFSKLYKKLKKKSKNQKLIAETPELSSVFSGVVKNLLLTENENNHKFLKDRTKKAPIVSLHILSLLKRRNNEFEPNAKTDFQSHINLATLMDKAITYLNSLVSHPLFNLFKTSPIFEKKSSIGSILEQGNKIQIQIYKNLLCTLKSYNELSKLNKLNELVLKNPLSLSVSTPDNLLQKILKSKENILLLNKKRQNALYQEIIQFIMVCLNQSNGLYNLERLNQKNKNKTLSFFDEQLLEMGQTSFIKKEEEQKRILNNAFLLLKPFLSTEDGLMSSGQTESLKRTLLESLNEQNIYKKWLKHKIIYSSKQEQILNTLNTWSPLLNEEDAVLKNNVNKTVLKVRIKQSITTRILNEQIKQENDMLSAISELKQRGVVGEQFVKQMKALVLKNNLKRSLNNNKSKLVENLSKLNQSLLMQTDSKLMTILSSGNTHFEDLILSLNKPLDQLSQISYQKQFKSIPNSLKMLFIKNEKDISVMYERLQQKVKNKIEFIFNKKLYTSKLTLLKQQNKISDQQYTEIQQNLIKQFLLQKGTEKTNLVLSLEKMKKNKMINNSSYYYLKNVLAIYSQKENQKNLKIKTGFILSESLWSRVESLIPYLGAVNFTASSDIKYTFEQEQRIVKAHLKLKNNFLSNGIQILSSCPESFSLIKQKLTNNITESSAFINLWNSSLYYKSQQDFSDMTLLKETLWKLEQLLNGQLLEAKQHELLKTKLIINSSQNKEKNSLNSPKSLLATRMNVFISELSALDNKMFIDQTIFAQLNESLKNLKSSKQLFSNDFTLGSFLKKVNGALKNSPASFNRKGALLTNKARLKLKEVHDTNFVLKDALIIKTFLARSLSPLNIQNGLKTLYKNNLILNNQYAVLTTKVLKLQNLYALSLNYKGSKASVRNKQYRFEKVQLLKDLVIMLSNSLNNTQLLKLTQNVFKDLSSFTKKQITEKINNTQKYEQWNNQNTLTKAFEQINQLLSYLKRLPNQSVLDKKFKQILEKKSRLVLAKIKRKHLDAIYIRQQAHLNSNFQDLITRQLASSRPSSSNNNVMLLSPETPNMVLNFIIKDLKSVRTSLLRLVLFKKFITQLESSRSFILRKQKYSLLTKQFFLKSISDLNKNLNTESLIQNPESLLKFTENYLLNEFILKWVPKLNKLQRTNIIQPAQYIFISRELESLLINSATPTQILLNRDVFEASKNSRSLLKTLNRFKNLSFYCENIVNIARGELLLKKDNDLINQSANRLMGPYLNGLLNKVQKSNTIIYMNPIKYRMYQKSIVPTFFQSYTQIQNKPVKSKTNKDATRIATFRNNDKFFNKNVTKTFKQSIYLSKLVLLKESGMINEAQLFLLKSDKNQKYAAISKAVRQHMRNLYVFERRLKWKFINYRKYEILSLRSVQNLKQKATNILALNMTKKAEPKGSFINYLIERGSSSKQSTLIRIKNLLNRTLARFSFIKGRQASMLKIKNNDTLQKKTTTRVNLKTNVNKNSQIQQLQEGMLKKDSSLKKAKMKVVSLNKKLKPSVLAVRFVRICQDLVNNLLSKVSLKSQILFNRHLVIKKGHLSKDYNNQMNALDASKRFFNIRTGQELQSLLIQKGAFETLKQLSAISSLSLVSAQKQIAKQRVFEHFIDLTLSILRLTKGNTFNNNLRQKTLVRYNNKQTSLFVYKKSKSLRKEMGALGAHYNKQNKTRAKNREILNKMNSFGQFCFLSIKTKDLINYSLKKDGLLLKIKMFNRLKIRKYARRVVQLNVLKYGALRTQTTFKLLKKKLVHKLVHNIQTQKSKPGFVVLKKLRFINKNKYSFILSKIKLKAQKQKISSVINKMGTLDILRNISFNNESTRLQKSNNNQKEILISAVKTLYQLQQQKFLTKHQYDILLKKIKLVSKYAQFASKFIEFKIAGLITDSQYSQFKQKIYQKVKLQIRSFKILQKFKLYTQSIQKIKQFEAKIKAFNNVVVKEAAQQVSKNNTLTKKINSSTGSLKTSLLKNNIRSSNKLLIKENKEVKTGVSVKPYIKAVIKQTLSKKSLFSAKQGKWNFVLLRQLRRQKLINGQQYKQLSKTIKLRMRQNNKMIRNLMQNLSKLNQNIKSKLSLNQNRLRITLINSKRTSLFKNISKTLKDVWNLGMLDQLRRRKLISGSLYNKLKKNYSLNLVKQSSNISKTNSKRFLINNASLQKTTSFLSKKQKTSSKKLSYKKGLSSSNQNKTKNQQLLFALKNRNNTIKDNQRIIKTNSANIRGGKKEAIFKNKMGILANFSKKVRNKTKLSVFNILSQKESLALSLFKLYAKRASRLQKLNKEGLITNLRYRQKLIQIFRSILKLEKMAIVQQSKQVASSKFNRLLNSSKQLVYWISAAHQVMFKKKKVNLSKKGKHDKVSILQKAKLLKIAAYKQAVLSLLNTSLSEEGNTLKRAKSVLRTARLKDLVKSGLISQKQYLLLRNRMKKALLRLAKLDKLQEAQNKVLISLEGIKAQKLPNLASSIKISEYKALYSKIIKTYLRVEFKFIESDLRTQMKMLKNINLKEKQKLLRSKQLKNSNIKTGEQLNPFLRTLIAQLPPKRSQKINTILKKLRQKLAFDETLIKKIQPQLIKFIEKRYGPPLPIPPHLVLKRWKIQKPVSKQKRKQQGNKKYLILPVGIVRDMSSRKAVGLLILERLIVEYYSRK